MLSIVATPIGNLKDITLRSLEALRSCTTIICEDTRVTGQLLKLLDLPKKELISFHGYSDPAKIQHILDRLEHHEHLCLVSDAGTPGISDPGAILVSRVRKAGYRIEVLPGPSAFLAALSASGLPIHHFTYLGFLPIKKGRRTLFSTFVNADHTCVFYESPHRILKTLAELTEVLKDQPLRRIVIARELTKLHEEVIDTTIGELHTTAERLRVLGEFTVVLSAREPSDRRAHRPS